MLETIATKTNLVIDFGGGLKSDEDLKIAFNSGASMITGGSIAVKDPDTFCGWIDKFGGEKIRAPFKPLCVISFASSKPKFLMCRRILRFSE